MMAVARSRMRTTSVVWGLGLSVLGFVFSTRLDAARQAVDRPEFGNYVALWRITHDPTIEDQANYHTQPCWSPNGRYLNYSHRVIVPEPSSGQSMFGTGRPRVRIFDFFKDEDRDLGLGIMQTAGPCWANKHNWLFYVQTTDADRGFAADGGSPVIWVDADTGKEVKVGDGFDQLGGVDCNDEWVYGGIKDTTRKPPFRSARARITTAGGRTEELREVTGFQWIPNPSHPLFFTRHDHPDAPFDASRYFWDLDGSRRRIGTFGLETVHATWQGNGEHLILGDGLCRGRRWNEPAGDAHVLAAGAAGNISACGRSGRFLVGDAMLFDCRSGDSWSYKYYLSPKLKPSKTMYPSWDGEAKGSPDGTKVSFTVHYDMEKGPVTELAAPLRAADDSVRVKSTAGFPDRGEIVMWCEVISYGRRSGDAFEDIQRGVHGTMVGDHPAGRAVTDFRFHLLTDDQWKGVRLIAPDLRYDVKDPDSPLMRQRRNSIWVAVVRRPDRPALLAGGTEVSVVPGESHYETRGYHLLCDGRRITREPLAPGATYRAARPGEYAAVAVEWSGLESDPGPPLKVSRPMAFRILADPPARFSWTRERWLVRDREAEAMGAKAASQATREVIHLADGVIARESFERGLIVTHEDMTPDGRVPRRVTYANGKVATREYFDRDGRPASREVFGPDGHIQETIRFGLAGGNPYDADHWWFEKGTPVRRISGRTVLVKQGERWTEGESR